MTNYNFIDRTGQTHGRLTVIGRSTAHKRTYWDCLCECGNNTTVRGDHLKEGRVTSCGCYSEESHTKHGMSRTKEYVCWQNMKDRCHNKNNRFYFNYRARGIKVCDRWINSFENFIEDMGECTNDLTLDRINNDGDYNPNNCKWATRKEQVTNKRNNILYTINGKTLCLKDWCREYSISYSTVRARLKKGIDIINALGAG